MAKKKSNIIGGYSAKDFKEDYEAFLLEEKGIDTGHFKKTIYVLPAKPGEVKDVRKKLAVTQQGFADIVGVSLQTIKAWETGLRNPDGPASKLMRILKADPKFAEKWAKA